MVKLPTLPLLWHRGDYKQSYRLFLRRRSCNELGASEISGDNEIAKVSLVGVGMRSHAGSSQ